MDKEADLVLYSMVLCPFGKQGGGSHISGIRQKGLRQGAFPERDIPDVEAYSHRSGSHHRCRYSV